MKEGLKLKHLDLSAQEFAELVREYFYNCDNPGKPPSQHYTVPGLAIHLDWKTNDVLMFPHTHPYYPIIERALLKCEESLIQAISRGSFDRATGFLLLKNHFGYQDKMEKENTNVKKTISQVLDEMENKK